MRSINPELFASFLAYIVHQGMLVLIHFKHLHFMWICHI